MFSNRKEFYETILGVKKPGLYTHKITDEQKETVVHSTEPEKTQTEKKPQQTTTKKRRRKKDDYIIFKV